MLQIKKTDLIETQQIKNCLEWYENSLWSGNMTVCLDNRGIVKRQKLKIVWKNS